MVTHISMEVLSHKILQHQHNVFSCLLGENQPAEDITIVLLLWKEIDQSLATRYKHRPEIF